MFKFSSRNWVRKNLIKTVLLIFIAFCAEHIYVIYTADIYLEQSKADFANREFSRALKYADKALRANPLEPNYFKNRAKTYLGLLTLQELNSNIDEIKQTALNDMEKAMELNPNNLVTARNLTPLYYFIAVDDLNLPASPGNVDQDYIDISADFLKYVGSLAPKDAGVAVLLAKYQGKLGLTDDYEHSILKIEEMRPDLLEWYLHADVAL